MKKKLIAKLRDLIAATTPVSAAGFGMFDVVVGFAVIAGIFVVYTQSFKGRIWNARTRAMQSDIQILKQHIVNNVDCGETIQAYNTECTAGVGTGPHYIAAYATGLVETISDVDLATTKLNKYALRASCGYSVWNEIKFEYQYQGGLGASNTDPLTGKPYIWTDLFPDAPIICNVTGTSGPTNPPLELAVIARTSGDTFLKYGWGPPDAAWSWQLVGGGIVGSTDRVHLSLNGTRLPTMTQWDGLTYQVCTQTFVFWPCNPLPMMAPVGPHSRLMGVHQFSDVGAFSLFGDSGANHRISEDQFLLTTVPVYTFTGTPAINVLSMAMDTSSPPQPRALVGAESDLTLVSRSSGAWDAGTNIITQPSIMTNCGRAKGELFIDPSDGSNHMAFMCHSPEQRCMIWYSDGTTATEIAVSNQNAPVNCNEADQRVSIAAYSGNIFVAYYDSEASALGFAGKRGAGPWKSSLIDMSGDVGAQPTLMVYDNDKIYIAYIDKTNGEVKLAANWSNDWDVPGGGTWFIRTITSYGDVDTLSELVSLFDHDGRNNYPPY